MRNVAMKCAALLVLVLCAIASPAQTTTVSATIVDPSSTPWGGASYTATVVSKGQPPVTIPGYVPFTTKYSGTANSSGVFSVTVQSVASIFPAGATWQFCVVSGVTFPESFCVDVPVGNTGQPTEDISSQINAILVTPSITGGPSIRAYNDAEVTAYLGAQYFNVNTLSFRCYNGSWNTCGGGGGGGSPAAPANSIQLANSGVNGFASDSEFQINPTTHTFSNTGNMLINALSSTPRAIYDPMDTKFCNTGATACGLKAAITAGGTAPTQVIQAAIDYGECQIVTGASPFQAMEIPLPSGITIPITGIKLWDSTMFGGDSSLTGPILQHADASQPMIYAHTAGDTIVCSGTSYNPVPGGVAGVYIHDILISGMGAQNTDTDIGIELNMESSAAVNIIGTNQGFGAAAVLSNGTSTFLEHIGFPGGQMKGCMTYNGGVRPVSGFTLGGGRCASVMDSSLDGGLNWTYATDGQAFASGHAAGPCYPNCAAVSAGGSGTYDDNIFAQVSSVGLRVDGIVNKINQVRVDFTSREAVQFSGNSGGGNIMQLVVDAACTDTALQAAYNAGTATGCAVSSWLAGGGYGITNMSVADNSGILAPAYVQCWVNDGESGGSGASSTWDLRGYQGSPQNTTANDWAFCGQFDGSQVSGRAIFPAMAPEFATGTTVNVSGITAIKLNAQTVNSIIGGIGGQTISITGPGTVSQTSNIFSLNGQSTVLASGQVVTYTNISGLGNAIWQMVSGPPNQTPTHVNFAGNPTVSLPSLIDVYGNVQARQIPALAISTSQLHGPTGSGSACFEEQVVFPDGSNVVTPLACTSVNLATQTPGEIFAALSPQGTPVLYLVTNTEGNGVATGRYPAPASGGGGSFFFWDGPTTIAAGGDGTTPPPASDNNTGEYWAPYGVLLNTAIAQPTCNAEYRGLGWIVRGSGATPDSYQICSYNGSGFSWVVQGGTTTFPLSCQPGIGDGLNAIPAGTYLTTTCKNETGQTWTLTAIRCVADSGSSTCAVTNGAGTALLTGAITGSSTYANGTQSGTTTIASGDYLKVTYVADGTSKQIGIDVTGTY